MKRPELRLNSTISQIIAATILFFSLAVFILIPSVQAQEQKRLNNAMIEVCVRAEAQNGRAIIDCIGRFSKPCRAREDNKSPVMQEECLEHEFVLWDQLLRKQVKGIKDAIQAGEAQERFKTSHDFWVKHRQAECRLPYILLPPGFTSKQMGLDCAIRLTARRLAEIKSLERILQK